MSASPSAFVAPADQRGAAYTTPRPDVFEMVPTAARQILDVGCSNGALGRSLLAGRADRSVCGIEFDPIFANEAAKHLDYVVTADLNQLDFDAALADRRFDCIIFADVLEHLIEPRRCLVQVSRFLQPGGCVVVSLPNVRHLSALRAIFLGGHFPQRDRGIFDRTHMRWFTIADAHALLADCGLQVTSMGLALRWGDRGGGRVNRLLNELPKPVRHWYPIREFLTYQVCLQAKVRP